MISFFDIVIGLILSIICFIVAVIIMTGTDMPLLFFTPIIFYALLTGYLKRRKKIAKYLIDDFKKMGYSVLSERPLKFSESTFEMKPTTETFVNNIPLSRYRYIRKFARVFEVETQTNERFELNTIVTKHWSGEKSIDIKKKLKNQ